ncbi:MAG: dTDP-4-dehydrorhamnose 3,5-epimerase family protein [Bacteroidetes bacterium]|nr:dTDP-4-dehydrorhamnose 3,5-epimerase family protein [Bacteroidota bacterium]
MTQQFKFGEIDGIIVKPLQKFSDSRGWLLELFREDEIDKNFLPKMSYISMTNSGVVRGPHEHKDQADMFIFLESSKFKLYLWDNRTKSKTYLNKKIIEVGEKLPSMVIIPPGIVHAYKNIGDGNGITLNFPNKLFGGFNKKEVVDEVRHESNPNSPFKIDE